tara:strand:+ start:37 stop:564 length:528 start_codon:yes stop_codon:yes gene_type:complete
VASVDFSIDVATTLGYVPPSAEDDVQAVLDDVVFDLGEWIDATCPVDTGAFQADWDLEAVGTEIIMRNAREYASWVHEAGAQPKDDPIRYWMQVEDKANQLLGERLAELQALVAATVRRESAAQVVPRRSRTPIPVSLGQRLRGASDFLFAARAAGLERVSTRSRERARTRARRS